MPPDKDLLAQWASKYIWWKTPEDSLLAPERIIAQVMELGDYDDVLRLVEEAGEETLRDILRCAEAGQFSPRSWAYWHYRLGVSEAGHLPGLPQRKVA
jgi:hypothetical protein